MITCKMNILRAKLSGKFDFERCTMRQDLIQSIKPGTIRLCELDALLCEGETQITDVVAGVLGLYICRVIMKNLIKDRKLQAIFSVSDSGRHPFQGDMSQAGKWTFGKEF